MKLILAISLALISFSGTMALPGMKHSKDDVVMTDANPLIANHVRFIAGDENTKTACQAVYTEDFKDSFDDISGQEECDAKKNKGGPETFIQEAKYSPDSGCIVTTFNDYRVKEFVGVDTEEKCLSATQEFFQEKHFVPFLDYETWHQQTLAQFSIEAEKFEAALNSCTNTATPGLNPVYRYDKRVKEIASLKDKIFDRTIQATGEQQGHMRWDYSINDGIVFRAVVDTARYPGSSQAITVCLEEKLHGIGRRTRDKLTYYMSQTYNVPSMNVVNGQPGGDSILEYQIWSLAAGGDMVYRHDDWYKAPKHLKKEEPRQNYFRSLGLAAECLDSQKFIAQVSPKSENDLEDALYKKCLTFLENQHEAKEATKKEEKRKPFKSGITQFTLKAPAEITQGTLDLAGIVWGQMSMPENEKTITKGNGAQFLNQ